MKTLEGTTNKTTTEISSAPGLNQIMEPVEEPSLPEPQPASETTAGNTATTYARLAKTSSLPDVSSSPLSSSISELKSVTSSLNAFLLEVPHNSLNINFRETCPTSFPLTTNMIHSHFKPLTVLLWNSNGLLNHIDELHALIQIKDIDVVLLTETHLTPRNTFYITGYKTYRTDHPDGTAHGGSAILVRASLPHYLLPNQFPPDPFQSTTISLQSTSQPTHHDLSRILPSKQIFLLYHFQSVLPIPWFSFPFRWRL